MADVGDKSKPSSLEVGLFHTNSDADGNAKSLHHTLGFTIGQASPGDHTHNGGSSKMLMEGITISGAKGGNIALTNLIAALSVALGFTDATT